MTAEAERLTPMPTPTVENYVKQIYLEQLNTEPGALVPMGKLAAAMGVVPGTATTMVKALSDSGLVDYEPRGGVRLTRGGEQLALHVLRRHRLVELFLVKVLGLDWSEVHEEAEELEHAVSDKVLERMDQVFGHPSVDPHGDPIPSAKGKVDESRHGSLADCALNKPCRIARVLDQDPAFLQFVERCGLMPGVNVTVEVRDALADAVWVRPKDRRPLTLGTAAAAKILVENA
jgi:DtxR family transcriptional regulator, Mn-dependent transcriptional regulator